MHLGSNVAVCTRGRNYRVVRQVTAAYSALSYPGAAPTVSSREQGCATEMRVVVRAVHGCR
jgi:hypothetical protein